MDISLEIQNYCFKECQRKKKIIETFLRENGMTKVVYKNKNTIFWLLDDPGHIGVQRGLANKLLVKQRDIQAKGIINNCYPIATDIVQCGFSTGRIRSVDSTQNFVGWGNHCLSYGLFNNRHTALDFTAGPNIDHDQGNFHLLGVSASSLDILQIRLSTLYGGSWGGGPMNHGEPNCISYAYISLGVDQSERGREVPSLQGLLEKFTPVSNIESAQAIAFYSQKIDAVVHMSVFDEQDKSRVWEREGVGKDPSRVELKTVLEKYMDPIFGYKKIYLRRKKS